MTYVEWLTIAHMKWLNSEDGKRWQRTQVWREDAELSADEWRAKYGLAPDQS